MLPTAPSVGKPGRAGLAPHVGSTSSLANEHALPRGARERDDGRPGRIGGGVWSVLATHRAETIGPPIPSARTIAHRFALIDLLKVTDPGPYGLTALSEIQIAPAFRVPLVAGEPVRWLFSTA